MDKLKILHDWYAKVWLEQDFSAIGSYFTPDSETDGMSQGLSLRPDDFAELIPAVMQVIVDPSFEVVRAFETDDWLWVLLVVRARARNDLHPVEITGQVTMRFDGDRIAEAYNHYDFVAFFEQIGALPEHTMALCLSGERLG